MLVKQFPALFGKYILLKHLGNGGMAELYCAKALGEETFQRLVAVKCMLPQLTNDNQFVNMFVDEAKLVAQIDHANVVQIFDLGRVGPHLFIAMELVQGFDVRAILKTCAQQVIPLDPWFVAFVISEAAEGLNYVHNKVADNGKHLHLIHRDVSPQNLLVGFDGAVKITDFGIAKAKHRLTETQAGVLKGKFSYMAPELVAGKGFDYRVDIFALGCVLFEMLTGKKLFGGEDEMQILESIRETRIDQVLEQLPSNLLPFIPILKQALAKNPHERYLHAQDMATDLTQLLLAANQRLGKHHATEWMQKLYEHDIVKWKQDLRRFSDISPANCLEDLERNEPMQPVRKQWLRTGTSTNQKSVWQKPSIARNSAPAAIKPVTIKSAAATQPYRQIIPRWYIWGSRLGLLIMFGIYGYLGWLGVFTPLLRWRYQPWLTMARHQLSKTQNWAQQQLLYWQIPVSYDLSKNNQPQAADATSEAEKQTTSAPATNVTP